MSDVRKLFHDLNQVKESLALVMPENERSVWQITESIAGK